MHPIDYTVIVFYFALVIGIGFWYQRRASKNLDSYFLGGKSKHWLALAGLSVLVLVVPVSCDQPGYKTIRFGLASVPLTLDPRFATDASSVRLIRLIYHQLVDFDKQSRPAPALAGLGSTTSRAIGSKVVCTRHSSRCGCMPCSRTCGRVSRTA